MTLRFACEALSYLTLDADVKEWIVEDSLLLQAIVCLARSAGALCVYTLASIYVNLTNSYDKPKVDEEMVKLAQVCLCPNMNNRSVREASRTGSAP